MPGDALSRCFAFVGLLFIGCNSPQNNAKRVCHCWDAAFDKTDPERQKDTDKCSTLENRIKDKYSSNPEQLSQWKETLSQCFEEIKFPKRAKQSNVLCDLKIEEKAK